MQLFQSWKESLLIFKPQNLRLFLLITLKSIVETYKVWLKYWGWLIIVKLFISLLFQHGGLIWEYADYISDYIELTLIFGLFLAVRSSLEKKDFHYFFGYQTSMHFITFSLAGVIFIFVWLLSWSILTYIFLGVPPRLVNVNWWLMYGILYMYLFTFYSLFLLDSDCSFNNLLMSLTRALKMIFYNIPFMIISSIILGLFLWMLQSFLLLGSLLYPILLLLLVPIPLCFLTNFYIKRIHDQFDLYFPKEKGT